jgi:NAD(P)-dependent dehydrogenase (short-subunit alcohol dehydrogenase family)
MTASSRVAVVTGAARGIGRRVAEVLAENRYTLVVTDLEAAAGTVAAVRKRGSEVLDLPGDVSQPEDVAALAEDVQQRLGHVDALVNNAGISLISPAEDTTPARWSRVLDVNLTGPFLLCRAFGPMMLEAGAGSIVNVASIAGLRGVSDRVAYNASKHGLIGLTRTLAAEWGGRGVRVNAVCPSWVKTEMDIADQAAGRYEDRDIVEQVPMGRFATPDDVAAAIAFLVDPAASSFINGAALPVDGGWTADASWARLRLQKR